MSDQESEVSPKEVLMAEKVSGNMDSQAAYNIAAQGGYVHHEGNSFVAYIPIRRAYDWFRKLFERATENNPPPK